MDNPITEPKAFVGVDPGASGAVAILGEVSGGVINGVVDAPRTLKDIASLVSGFAFVMPLISAVEAPTPVPKQGVASVSMLYKSIGWWEAALVTYGDVYRVRPQDWKRSIAFDNAMTGQRLSKAWARQVAARLYPRLDLGKRSDEGRAEAVLIAHYLMKNFKRLTLASVRTP